MVFECDVFYHSDTDVLGGRVQRGEGLEERPHGGVGVPPTADQEADPNLPLVRRPFDGIVDDRPVTVGAQVGRG